MLFKAQNTLFLVEFIVYIILFVVQTRIMHHRLIFVEAPTTQDTPDNQSTQHLHQRHDDYELEICTKPFREESTGRLCISFSEISMAVNMIPVNAYMNTILVNDFLTMPFHQINISRT